MKIEIVRTGDDEQVVEYEIPKGSSNTQQMLMIAWQLWYGTAIKEGMNPAASIKMMFDENPRIYEALLVTCDDEDFTEHWTVREVQKHRLHHVALEIAENLARGAHLQCATVHAQCEVEDAVGDVKYEVIWDTEHDKEAVLDDILEAMTSYLGE
jgi:hypothetical protein